MWPFKKKPSPKAQLRHSKEKYFDWWSVWVWRDSVLIGGYWVYVKGTTDEAYARRLYASCAKHGNIEDVVVEQS